MWLLFVILVLIIAALFIIAGFRSHIGIKFGSAEPSAPTYLFSGFDGSYLWYLAELMQKDGARPANKTGFVMRGESAHATYLHRSLDNLYWFSYDDGPAHGDFENVLDWPSDIPCPACRSDLYKLIDSKSYAPKTTHIAKFIYEPSKKYIAHMANTDHEIAIISDENDYNNIHDETKRDIFISELIPSKRINDRAFVLTMYVMLDGANLRLCDYGFVCLCDNTNDIVCYSGESIARSFPQEYPGDSGHVLGQIRAIVGDCEQFFLAGASKKCYKVYKMDISVDENEKCWLLEFSPYFKFYNMLPEQPYSDTMCGIMDWVYKYGIRPRLFQN